MQSVEVFFCPGVASDLIDLWNRSKLGDKDVGDLLSHVVKIVGASVHDDGSDVGLNFVHVHHCVLEYLGKESNWVLEDRSPDLDSFDVWLDSFAIFEIVVDGSNHLTDDGDTLNDVSDIFFGEISNGFGKFNLKSFRIAQTWLDCIKIIVLYKTSRRPVTNCTT